MIRRRWIAGLLSAFLATIAVPAHAEWLEVRNEHYVIRGDMSVNDMNRFVDKVHRFDAAVRSILKPTDLGPVSIYVVQRASDVAKITGRENVAGFYRPNAQESLIVAVRVDAGGGGTYGMSADSIFLHEYAHHMTLGEVENVVPSWYSEGMAELLMSAKFEKDGSVVFGAPTLNRGFEMFSMSRLHVRDVLNIDYMEKPPGMAAYTRGWLLVHYLLLGGERDGQLARYIAAVNRGMNPVEAGRQVFGDLDRLDEQLERYVRRAKLPSAVVPAADMKAGPVPQPRRMDEGEAAIMPYRLASAVGVNPRQARILAARARPVAVRFPNHGFVQRSLAEMEYDAKNFDAAAVAADRALAVDPNDKMAMVYKGRVLVHKAMAGDAAQWKQARSLFLRANKLDPNFALPFALYRDSFLAEGKPVPADAVKGMERAVVLVPQDAELRIRLAMDYLRDGDMPGFRKVIGPVAFAPHRNADENVALQMMKLAEAGDVAKARALAKEKKWDRFSEFAPIEDDKKSDEG